MAQIEWVKLLSSGRRKKKAEPVASAGSEIRTSIERDHDRILFSTPVRRLADKTQVFPLEKNDSVRNRLTHSCEVSNLARSVGTALAFAHDLARPVTNSKRDIPALCAAIGLVHDLGNPPFGHQGEAAIQSWFVEHESAILSGVTSEDAEGFQLSSQQREDFLKFEGNAQGFRLVTRLQLLNDNFGLDLSFATLSAMMKYPTPSNAIEKSNAAKKKHGFFASEQEIAEEVLGETGLQLGWRHPLAYVMEACDDIAYVVFDVEDSIKKGLASISDLHAYLEHHAGNDPLTKKVVKESKEKHNEYRLKNLSPAELNDVSMQRFRVFAISEMINAAIKAFVDNEVSFLEAPVAKTLMELSEGETLRGALKDFAVSHAYVHKSVLCVELEGYNVIRALMDMFWAAIVDRKNKDEPNSKRKHPFTRLVYARISENYRRFFETPPESMAKFPMRYRECLLLPDMISGMTDRFALDLHDELSKFVGDFDVKQFRNNRHTQQ